MGTVRSYGRVFVTFSALMVGLVMTSAVVGTDEKPANLEALMEQVNTVNKALVKHNRLNKGAFEGKAAEIAKDSDKLAELAKLMPSHAPKENDAKKPKKTWDEAAEGVQKASDDMTKAAKGKKHADFRAAFKRMEASCTKCHEVFRDE